MVHTAMLVVLDSLAMLLAFDIARKVRGSSAKPFAHAMTGAHFAELMLATVPLWVAIFSICGLYRMQVNGGRVSEAGRVIAGVVGGVMLLISFDYLRFNSAIFPSHSVPVLALLFGIPLVVLERQLVRSIMRALFGRGKGLHNVILMGTGDLASRIADELTGKTSGYRVLAAVGSANSSTRLTRDVPVYATVESAFAAYPEQRVQSIIQADLDIPRDEAVRMMSFANEKGMTYRFVPDKYGVYAAASTMATIGGVPVMEVRLTALDGWGALGKRVFDVIGSVLLLIVFSPLLAAVALAVKIAEPSAPVFYQQQRIGLRGRSIKVMKFRSMRWKYSTGPDREFKTAEDAFTAMGREDLITEFLINQKIADDPRVSRLGAFLRKTSLDELPQLINTLRGDLSLVGPRPITQGELDRYGPQANSFLALKPGMTGLWQVYGRSGTTYEERVKLDIYYVENWSVGMDVSILARTLVSVAARKGAQ